MTNLGITFPFLQKNVIWNQRFVISVYRGSHIYLSKDHLPKIEVFRGECPV